MKHNFSENYARDLLRYSKRYYHVLLNGDASVLLGISSDTRRLVMSSLANLSKYLGVYDQWKALVKKYGLKWESRSSLETFISILNTNIEDVKDWLMKVIRKLPRDYAVVEVFLALTGLRPSEGINSLELISHLSEIDQLDNYLNEELLMLEHFRYPKMFLRRSKNAYISFVTQNLLDLVLEIKPRIKYATLDTKINRLGFSNKTKHLRKLYATYLRNNGIPSEVIDILQGRISSSIFLRFYYKPFLKEIRNKVIKAIKPLEQNILSYF